MKTIIKRMMGVVNEVIFDVYICLSIVFLSGCSDQALQPDSPENTALLLKQTIQNGDYASFNALFSEGRKGTVSETEFEELKKIPTAGAEFKNYEFITFDNGEMILLKLTPPDEKKEIKIEDIIVVPEEMKEMFR